MKTQFLPLKSPDFQMDTSQDLIRDYLGDVTSEEYNEYLEEEEKIIASLIERCDLSPLDLETKYRTFLTEVRNYYIRSIALLTIGTHKKLVDHASQTDKKAIYFAAWMAEWIAACYFVVNDICDRKTMRASHPTLPVQLGSSNAMCLYITVNNYINDLAVERFSQEPFLNQFLTICRNHANLISVGMLTDTSCGKYDKRRDFEWYKVREFTSCTAAVGILPVELAFCLAGKSIESEVGKYMVKLANVLGPFARAIDDASDWESDLIAGRLNWAFWAAWEVADEEQRKIMSECSTGKSYVCSREKLVKLLAELDIQSKFEAFVTDTKNHLEKLISDCPEEIPGITWKANIEYWHLIYSGAAGSTFHEQ